MKHDLKKDRTDLYRPGTRDFELVDVPELTYLAFDGEGDPNTAPAYAQAVQSLYTTAYATKFAFKARTGHDFVVGPLEGLWSSDDPHAFTARMKDDWKWTMLIPLPDAVTSDDIETGRATAARKKPELPIAGVRLLRLTEGPCLQIMHIGSYDDEAPTLARLHDEIMPAQGWTFNGPHHEIYLSDPRRVEASKLKTILRQPVVKVAPKD